MVKIICMPVEIPLTQTHEYTSREFKKINQRV